MELTTFTRAFTEWLYRVMIRDLAFSLYPSLHTWPKVRGIYNF